MKKYELTVLIHPLLESDLDKALEKIKNIITASGGNIVRGSDWGKKKLAYKIKQEDFAIYYGFDLELPADAPIKISASLNIADEVLRYLLVLVDEKAQRAKARQLEAEQPTDDSDKENKKTDEAPTNQEEE